jgi:hypothetical protein
MSPTIKARLVAAPRPLPILQRGRMKMVKSGSVVTLRTVRREFSPMIDYKWKPLKHSPQT